MKYTQFILVIFKILNSSLGDSPEELVLGEVLLLLKILYFPESEVGGALKVRVWSLRFAPPPQNEETRSLGKSPPKNGG